MVGLLAARALKSRRSAAVLARFERSFCLDVGGEPITIGDQDLHLGPLNLRLATGDNARLTTVLRIETGQRWVLSPDRLTRSDGLVIDLSKAVVWRPNAPATKPDRTRLRENLDHLHRLLLERDLPEDGLISLSLDLGPPRTATERAALPLLQALKADLPRLLENTANADPARAARLLGLGPGLTPSGDDLLAGLLIAWRQLGAVAAADRLARALLDGGQERTTVISLAHLRAAAKGYGAAPLHDLLDAIFGNHRQGLDEALDAAAKIGHSSGFDAIAGVMLAFCAWLEADNPTSSAA